MAYDKSLRKICFLTIIDYVIGIYRLFCKFYETLKT